MTKTIDELLSFDALAEAEKVTGKSYKDDKGTEALGMMMHIRHNERKEEALKGLGDTTFSRDMPWMRNFLSEQGFNAIHTHKFAVEDMFTEEELNETVEYFWHPEGILFVLESYHETDMNTCKAYFNWKANADSNTWPDGISGGFENGVLIADKDGREGFAHFLKKMRAGGSFLPKWEKLGFIWLLSYADSKVGGYDYNAINAARLAHFPQHVKDAMGA